MTDSGNSKNGDMETRQTPDTPFNSVVSIALIGPDDHRRKAFLNALSVRQSAEVSEFTSFPPDLEELPRTVGEHYDVVILDVDSDPDYVSTSLSASAPKAPRPSWSIRPRRMSSRQFASCALALASTLPCPSVRLK